MSEKPLPSLESLQQRLDAANPQKPQNESPPQSGAPDALRLGVELAAGVAVGAGIGVMLDRWLGTAPWLLIVCFFLGCAAGFLNLKRAAERMGQE